MGQQGMALERRWTRASVQSTQPMVNHKGAAVLQQEKEYYRSGNVLITNARAEMGGRTFAMANVTAVSMATTNPSPGCSIMFMIPGGFVALLGLVFMSDQLLRGGLVLMAGIILGVVGYYSLDILKPTYSVNIASASGESRAMESHNREEIEQIVEAIKRAMVERG